MPVAVNVAGQHLAVAQKVLKYISNDSLTAPLLLANPTVSTPSPLLLRTTVRNDEVKPASISVYWLVSVTADAYGTGTSRVI